MSSVETRTRISAARTLVPIALALCGAACLLVLLHGVTQARADPCGPSWMSSCYDNSGNAFTDGSAQRYRWLDQTDISPKPKPVYSWTDISTVVPPVQGDNPNTGNIDRQAYSSDCIRFKDPGTADTPIQFMFYGVAYDCAWVGSNGLIVLDHFATKTAPTGCPPLPPVPNQGRTAPPYCTAPARFSNANYPFAGIAGVVPTRPTVAGFWSLDMDPTTCLNPPSGNGGIFATAVGPVGQRKFIVEWNGVIVYAQDTPQVNCTTPANCQMPPHTQCYWNTFQIILYEENPNGATCGAVSCADTIDVMYKQAQTPDDPAPPSCTPPCPPPPPVPTCPASPGSTINCEVQGIYDPAPFNAAGITYGLTYQFNWAQVYTNFALRYYPNHAPVAQVSYLYEDPAAPAPVLLAPIDVDGDQLNCQANGIPPATKGVIDPALTAPNTACSRTFMPTQDFCTEWGTFAPVTFPEQITDKVMSTSNQASTIVWVIDTAQIRVYCVNDAPFVGTGQTVDVMGVQDVPLVFTDWDNDVYPGPFTAVDEDGQGILFVLTSPPPGGTFPGIPTLTRNPSLTSGTHATLTFTGTVVGVFNDICWRARDTGGLAPSSPPAYDTSIDDVCVNITILPHGSGGGNGSCGSLHPSFSVTGNQLEAGNQISFTDHSTSSGSIITGWSWDFGDGYTANTQDSTHAFGDVGSYAVRLTVVDDGGCAAVAATTLQIGTGANDGGVGADPSREPPFVDAGPDQVVLEGQHVFLGATATNLAAGVQASYTWRQASGPGASLQKPGTAAPDFFAPTLEDPDKPVDLVFAVKVLAGGLESPEDFVKVTVAAHNQRPPVANAGLDTTVDRGTDVTLDGSKSADPDGDVIAYAWTQVAGPRVSAFPASGKTVIVHTPADTDESYIDAQLTVSDGTYTSTDLVRIWLQAPQDPAVGFRATQLKDGSVSFVAYGKSTKYVWEFGDGATQTTTSNEVTHTYATSGTYQVHLVTDSSSSGYSQPIYTSVPRGVPDPEPESSATSQWLGFGLTLAVVAAFAVAGLLAWAWQRSNRKVR